VVRYGTFEEISMNMLRTLVALSLQLASMNALALMIGNEFHSASLAQQKNYEKFFHQGFRTDGSPRIMDILYFDQKLDHKNPTSETFKQRYFVDSSYAADNNSPVFYIICGEWNCAGTGSYGYAEGLARKNKAHLVALEHRFYGQSLPTSKLTPENLKHLDLESALEDLVQVQRHMMENRNLKGKWVAFGGSYAGTLAAFYRLKHPDLVVGALASSAPVFMKNEFFEYDAHIAKVVDKTTCGNKVREAVKLIEEKMKTADGVSEVKALFSASSIKEDRDFLYVVADMLAAAVQYGRDKVFCGALEKNPDLIAGYADGGLKVLGSMGTTPLEISLQIAEKVETTPDDNMRQWMWQSCREFGWFQVSNTRGSTSRSSQIDLKYHEDFCQRAYKTSMGTDGALNEEWYFPLLNPETSGIIFSNGGNDPWLTLSIMSDTAPANPELTLFMMDGAAHCNDLRSTPSLPSIAAAQVEMSKIIAKWVE
jgi:pimeloyl-ACP methyl ester carboxylesterase